MTVTVAAPGANSRASSPATAKRVRPPRWRDARLAAGVVVLLLSVLIGARLIGGADRTAPALVVTADLPAGHVLVAADLGQVRTRLTTADARYFRWAQARAVLGRSLSRGIAAGELLPRSAVIKAIDPGTLRDVPIVVEGLRVPRLKSGDLVDIYSTTKPTNQREHPMVTVVATGVEVIGDPPGREASVKVRLVVRVPEDGVEALVRATQLTEIDIVQHLPVSAR